MFDELGNLGDFIGGLAVIASLIYVARQIRQNTATIRVQTVQHLLTSDTAAVDSVIGGPIPAILAKLETGEKLSTSEIAAYAFYMRGRLTEAWQVFYQQQNGMIEKSHADALLSRLEFFANHGIFAVVWDDKIKIGFPPEFQEYVESKIKARRRKAESRG